nr:immunoglobulin heavy chain junction region [Macaca mulatta]MOV38424.1 immunoglobulin heavy chain junction region [Macaca mulatta]MOV38621.1 immunoglobulin heavy chain junction region [Macaca mulatta]MOV39593.1 immunoglobulin heavy chain junction region [Macaca mulatta]MOV39771.1 immunoglobulin heavy chain junction region [Macaca mulatta]
CARVPRSYFGTDFDSW